MHTANPFDPSTVCIEPCQIQQLPQVNDIIEAGIDSWQISTRVKRLSKPLYRYSADDLEHLDIRVSIAQSVVVGVVAWEQAEADQLPAGSQGLLLHGLYVSPTLAKQGLGRRLVGACIAASEAAKVDGLLVKAQTDAAGFFESLGFTRMPVDSGMHQYDLRYWLPTRASATDGLPGRDVNTVGVHKTD